jgi:hypothetical protein
MEEQIKVYKTAYWFLKSSFGVSTGVEENARSGRRDDTNEPIIEDMVGGESSEISWYALNIVCFQKASPQGGTGPQQQPHLTVAAAAYSAAQHTLRKTSTSVISPI